MNTIVVVFAVFSNRHSHRDEFTKHFIQVMIKLKYIYAYGPIWEHLREPMTVFSFFSWNQRWLYIYLQERRIFQYSCGLHSWWATIYSRQSIISSLVVFNYHYWISTTIKSNDRLFKQISFIFCPSTII